MATTVPTLSPPPPPSLSQSLPFTSIPSSSLIALSIFPFTVQQCISSRRSSRLQSRLQQAARWPPEHTRPQAMAGQLGGEIPRHDGTVCFWPTAATKSGWSPCCTSGGGITRQFFRVNRSSSFKPTTTTESRRRRPGSTRGGEGTCQFFRVRRSSSQYKRFPAFWRNCTRAIQRVATRWAEDWPTSKFGWCSESSRTCCEWRCAHWGGSACRLTDQSCPRACAWVVRLTLVNCDREFSEVYRVLSCWGMTDIFPHNLNQFLHTLLICSSPQFITPDPQLFLFLMLVAFVKTCFMHKTQKYAFS